MHGEHTRGPAVRGEQRGGELGIVVGSSRTVTGGGGRWVALAPF
ncbi:hypothetical protein [Amycolatopsis magusensis]